MGEDQQLGRHLFRLKGLSRQLQETAHLRRIGEIRKGAEVQGPCRLPPPSPAHEAAVPGLAALPGHGVALAVLDIVELQLGPLDGVGKFPPPAVGEVGEEAARGQVPRIPVRVLVAAGAGEEHRGLAAAVGPRQHADGIGERHSEILDAPQMPDADRPQGLAALGAFGP